jgi:hypothetical protein
MKPETTEDILELMNGYIVSAVLGTAMVLGIFWLLADKPLSAPELAQCLNIPLNRCHYLLQILCKLGLLEDSGEGYAPSTIYCNLKVSAPDYVYKPEFMYSR